MLEGLTTPIYNRMTVWGPTLLNAEVQGKLQIISKAVMLSAFLSFLSYSYEGAKIARAFVDPFLARILIGALTVGLPMAILTVLIDTYLVATSKRRNQKVWHVITFRLALIFLNSVYVSKGLVDLVTAVDRAHIIARDEANKVNGIRNTATTNARNAATAEITGMQGRTSEGVQADLTRCEADKTAKQTEINAEDTKMEDERRTGTRRCGPAAGIGLRH